MRAKLNNKKIHIGHNFVALFKGKEENFRIIEIDGSSESMLDEEKKEHDKSELSYIVNNAT